MNIDFLMSKLAEFKEELSKADAGHNPKVMISKKPLKPEDVKDVGPEGFKIELPKGSKASTSERHPVGKKSERIEFAKNGQWSIK